MTESRNLMIAGAAGKLAVRAKGISSRTSQIVVLVQGANLSGQAGYDVSFFGGTDYSMMEAMVARGIGAVTFSVRGYATSEAPPDPLGIDTDSAIEDLASVMDWLRTQGSAPCFTRPHLAGWSWGGRIVAQYTQANEARVERLVLMDPALGGGNRILPAPAEPWWTGARDYFNSRFEPAYTEPGFAQALTDWVLANEPRSPNGIRMENARGSKPSDGTQVRRPTLMIYGSGAARQDYMQGGLRRADFFESLATDDKQFVIIPGCGDYAHLQKPRRVLHKHVADFLLFGG